MSVPKYASDFPPGHLVKDYSDPASGLRIQVRVGRVSFCAYVGVQADHTLASLEDFDFDCHHHITFRDFGSDHGVLPGSWYWWGWDYAHFTDVMELNDVPPSSHLTGLFGEPDLDEDLPSLPNPKRWTADEVFQDALDVMLEIKNSLGASREYYSLLATSYGVTASLPS